MKRYSKYIGIRLLLLAAIMLGSMAGSAMQSLQNIDSIRYYNKLSVRYRSSHVDSSLFYAFKAMRLAEKHNLNKYRADACRHAGNAFYYKANYDSAIFYYEEAKSVYNLVGDTASLAKTLNNIAIFYKLTGRYQKALDIHDSVLKIKQMAGDIQGIAVTYNNMGRVFKDLALYEKALEYYFKSLTIKEELSDSISIAYTLNNIGNIYKLLGKTERTGDYYNRALKIYQDRNHPRGMGVIMNDFGELYVELGNSDKALEYFNRSIEVKKELRDLNGMAVTYNNIGNLYFKQDLDSTGFSYYKMAYDIRKEIDHKHGIAESGVRLGEYFFVNGDLKEAKKYLDEAFRISERNELLNISLSAYASLASLFEKEGDFEQAYRYRSRQAELNDSIYNRRLHKRASELQVKYELEKKESENELLRKDRALLQLEAQKARNMGNNVFFISLALVIGLGVFALWFIYRKNRKVRLKLEVINEELEKRVRERTADLQKEIQHRKRIESELVEINNEYRRVVSSVPDLIWSGRILPNGRFQHIHLSDGVERLSGRPKKFFLESFDKWNDIVHPDDRDRMEGVFDKALKGEISRFVEEYRIIKPGGEIIWLYDRESITHEEDGSLRFDSIVSDITRRKEMEKQLKEANATKDKFLSIIAHDLKVPFNAIMGFSELLNEHYDDTDDAEKKSYIRNIISASDSAFKLLENLLEWSRAQTGRLEIKPEVIDLSVLANDNIKEFRSGMNEKALKIRSYISYGTTAWADENSINTVIRNLLSNAIKFTPQGGKVELRAENTNDQVVISVTDTGVGIPQDQIPNLFRIDRKVESGENQEEGTGLGLILCKEFVENNGGKIWLESEYEKGTTFYFSLPAKKA